MHWILRHTLIYALVSISVNVFSASAFSARLENDIDKTLESRESQQQQQEHKRQQWPILLQRGICGTEEPSDALKEAHRVLSSTEARFAAGLDGNANRTAEESMPRIQIDTWFHIVSTNDKVDLVTNQMIASQLTYLQQAYSGTGIHYNLVGVDRSINDNWARNEDGMAMKQALRQGTYSTLNVYFQTDLAVSDPSIVNVRNVTAITTTSDYDEHNNNVNNDVDGAATKKFSRDESASLTSNLLGFCTLPDPDIESSSTIDDYINDGCNILAATMPGGSIEHYNRGGTTVHEVGHWHGLLHTFQDQNCAPGADGDYIGDTPQQSIPTEGCPTSKDSCPDLPGFDAITNFMDYSSDDCYQSFTSEQGLRMRSMWSSIRAGK